MTAREIAAKINRRGLYKRQDGEPVPANQLNARVGNNTYRDRYSKDHHDGKPGTCSEYLLAKLFPQTYVRRVDDRALGHSNPVARPTRSLPQLTTIGDAARSTSRAHDDRGRWVAGSLRGRDEQLSVVRLQNADEVIGLGTLGHAARFGPSWTDVNRELDAET